MSESLLVRLLITESIRAAVSDSWTPAVALAVVAAALHYGGKWWRKKIKKTDEE